MHNKSSQPPRRKYDASFKQEVIGMIAAGRPVPEIARSLGIGENVIYRWRKKALEGPQVVAGAPDGTAPSHVSLAEHLALQKRFRELEMEHENLKKAPRASSLGLSSGALSVDPGTGATLSHQVVVQGPAGQSQWVLPVPSAPRTSF